MVVEECVCVHVCARGRLHCNNTIGITVTMRMKCVSIGSVTGGHVHFRMGEIGGSCNWSLVYTEARRKYQLHLYCSAPSLF